MSAAVANPIDVTLPDGKQRPGQGGVGVLADEQRYLTVMIDGQKRFFEAEKTLPGFFAQPPGSRLRRMLATPGAYHELLALSFSPGPLAERLAALDGHARGDAAQLVKLAKQYLRPQVFEGWVGGRRRSSATGLRAGPGAGISSDYVKYALRHGGGGGDGDTTSDDPVSGLDDWDDFDEHLGGGDQRGIRMNWLGDVDDDDEWVAVSRWEDQVSDDE